MNQTDFSEFSLLYPDAATKRAHYEGEDASAGHGGADRKMLADFISCVAEGRKPVLDVDFAINMSLPGILAHESAVAGGVPIEIPQF